MSPNVADQSRVEPSALSLSRALSVVTYMFPAPSTPMPAPPALR